MQMVWPPRPPAPSPPLPPLPPIPPPHPESAAPAAWRSRRRQTPLPTGLRLSSFATKSAVACGDVNIGERHPLPAKHDAEARSAGLTALAPAAPTPARSPRAAARTPGRGRPTAHRLAEGGATAAAALAGKPRFSVAPVSANHDPFLRDRSVLAGDERNAVLAARALHARLTAGAYRRGRLALAPNSIVGRVGCRQREPVAAIARDQLAAVAPRPAGRKGPVPTTQVDGHAAEAHLRGASVRAVVSRKSLLCRKAAVVAVFSGGPVGAVAGETSARRSAPLASSCTSTAIDEAPGFAALAERASMSPTKEGLSLQKRQCDGSRDGAIFARLDSPS